MIIFLIILVIYFIISLLIGGMRAEIYRDSFLSMFLFWPLYSGRTIFRGMVWVVEKFQSHAVQTALNNAWKEFKES